MQGPLPGETPDADLRQELSIFDHNTDPALDELTELVAVLGNADFAYVGWVDFNRLWFKSRFGFSGADQPHATSACQWVISSGKPLLLTDASQDVRFPPMGIPLPGAEPCHSYAGVPLIAGNHKVIGTLAMLSIQPNQFRVDHLALMEILARQVVTRLELYNRIRAQEHAQRIRRRTERALAVERCFVEATLDSIPALVAVLDTAGRLVRMNNACAQLTGLNMNASVGRLFVEEVLEPEDRPWVAERLHEAAGGRGTGPHESAWRTAEDGNGNRRVSWTLRPLVGPSGEVQYLILSGQDVTEHRRMEMALLSNEARYREMVENSLGFVFTCTTEGQLTSLNAFTAETLGYRPEELLNRSVCELTDAAGVTQFQQCLLTLQERDEWQGALQLRRRDGCLRRIAFRCRRMQLGGERTFILNHGIDVTEQYQTEEALRLATRQRELILESVGDGIYGIDPHGTVTFINQTAAAALGYTPEQLTGHDMHEIVRHSSSDGTTYSRTTSPIFEAMRRSEPVRMRGELFWRKDGSSMPVEYSASPILEHGETRGVVVAFQDVAERLRLERMKDEFISTVSHELKTPLASLRASLGLIQSGQLDRRPEKQQQMVEMAIHNCDRLTRLVNDILDFDKMDHGQLPLRREPLEAANLLYRAADVAHPAATQAQIRIRVDASPATVLADEERILQVLNELVANALKFSPNEGTIRLIARTSTTADPDQKIEPGQVLFVVADQGRGIAPEKLQSIFERFQQGDSSDARARGGTGLGLALCKAIVEQHGGRIWAESAPGKGSRLLFTLPEAPSQ